jgi:hypothetical protein
MGGSLGPSIFLRDAFSTMTAEDLRSPLPWDTMLAMRGDALSSCLTLSLLTIPAEQL